MRRNDMRTAFSIILALATLLSPLCVFAGVTKANTVLANDVTMTAGAGDVTYSDDLTGAYRTLVRIRFTNGGTGPTVAPRCDVKVSEDTTTAHFMKLLTVNGDTVNSSVNEFFVELPDSGERLNVVCGSNTVQNVTLRLVDERITGI
jgi:hypothetical protein